MVKTILVTGPALSGKTEWINYISTTTDVKFLEQPLTSPVPDGIDGIIVIVDMYQYKESFPLIKPFVIKNYPRVPLVIAASRAETINLSTQVNAFITHCVFFRRDVGPKLQFLFFSVKANLQVLSPIHALFE